MEAPEDGGDQGQVQLRQLSLELLRQLWVGQDAAVRRSSARQPQGKACGQVPGVREGLPNPQARIQAFQVLLRSVPILLMRKLSEFQCGKVWPGTLQRLSK